MAQAAMDQIDSLLRRLEGDPALAEAFASVRRTDGRLVCTHADHDDVAYRVEFDGGRVWVVMATPDRWLSQSIEADLMYTGDKLEELVDEEANDLGYSGDVLAFEHFRSEQMEYVFRTPMAFAPAQADEQGASDNCSQFLRAYAIVFGGLGDLKPEEDEQA